MGIYLAKPNTETDSHDITSEKFNSGYSSMQGWRSAQEDAHNMIVDFLENISLFGVYDGHGGISCSKILGPEVAQYVSQHFPNFLRERYAKKSNEESLETFLQSSFLAFDARLKEPSTLAELRNLNGEEDEESNYNELISSNNNSACGLKRNNNKLRKQKITSSTTTSALKEGAGDSGQESDEQNQHQMLNNGDAFGHQQGDEMPTSSSILMNGSIDSEISFEIHEASLLRQEANMSIDEILANNYEGVENVKDDKTVITSVLSEETRNLLLGPDQQHSQQKDHIGNNMVNSHPHHVDDNNIKKVCTFTSTSQNNKVDMRKEKVGSSKSGTGSGRNPNSLAEFYNADMNQNDDSEDDSDFQVEDDLETSQDEDEHESSEEQTNDENESSEADELNEETDEETNKKSQQNASSLTSSEDQNELDYEKNHNKENNHSSLLSKDLTFPDKMVSNKLSEEKTIKPDSTTHINSSKNESLHNNLESTLCSEITSSTNTLKVNVNNNNTQINNVSTSENGLSASPKNKIEGIHREESILRRKMVVKGAKETSPQKDTSSHTDSKALPEFPTSLLNDDDDEHIETTSTTDINGNISTTSKDSTNTTHAAGKRKHSTTLENDLKTRKNFEIKEECNSSSSNNSRIDDNNSEKQKSPSKSLTGTLSSPLHKKLKEETTTIHMNGDIKHEQDIPVDSSSNCDSSDNSNAIISHKNKQNGELDSAEENADDHNESESESGDIADDYEDTDENGDDDEDDDDLDPRQAIFEEYLNAPKGKPGYDSGCTAVLAWLDTSDENCPDLYVANIGDSRCVVSNKGTAVDMSFDHKPEDEPEKERIEGAGGVVTEDGRVNEGLNLSRAFGDHHYKMEKSLDVTKQMIIALPDVKHCKITPNSDFIVLACDGIWNSMSSQQVIDFVEERKEEYYDCPSKICEQLFHECLAPGTGGDGTGCDNMTCIIIFPKKSNSTTSQ